MKNITLLIISLLLFASTSCNSQSNDDFNLSTNTYKDPKGFFSITPPIKWRIKEYLEDARGKVALYGPSSVEIRVLTDSVDFSSIDGIISHARAMEKKLGFNTNIEIKTFNGFPSIERTFPYKGHKFLYVDFLVGRISHNIAYSAPIRKYDNYLKIAKLSFSTYEPRHIKLTKKEEDENYLSKMRRLGEILTEQGSYKMAIEYVERGLALSPKDAELLNLKRTISLNIKSPNN
jgi:hypothetical protein